MRGMRAAKHHESELRHFAEDSIAYEVRMLVGHARELRPFLRDGRLPAGFPPDTPADAYLEAWLVHIRLLNEFLKDHRGRGAATADEWEPDGWQRRGFLEKEEREAVDRQLAHLSWKRDGWDDQRRPPWERPDDWTRRACERLVEFIDAVPAPRRSAFAEARSQAERALREIV
jgi:hypothetical protein